MPGVIGAIHKAPGHNIHATFNTLLAPMQRSSRMHTETRMDPAGRWALGRVHLGVLQPHPQLSQNTAVAILFQGDLHNEAGLRQWLIQAGHPTPGPGSIALLTALYDVCGAALAARLEGAFCAVILDTNARKVILINDLLGSYCLYWWHGPQRFVFASELKAVLRDPTLQPTLNPRAVADYLSFGFLLGDKTLAEHVRLLPPASTLTYGWDDGKYKLEGYARPDAMFQPWEGTQQEYLAELYTEFNRAVQRTLSGSHHFGLSLSGGLDSRTILSAIDCAHTPLSTYTLGVKGCADDVIARDLAQIAGSRQQFFALDARYMGEYLKHLQHMVALTDGMYLSHGLTEMLALQWLENVDCTVLLRGHGGELAKMSLAWPLHTDKQIYAIQDTETFLSYMLNRVNYISRGGVLRELFTDVWYALIADGARWSLEESLQDIRLSPPDLCSYLYLYEHHRRFTVASLELFRNLVEVRLPFVEHDFLRVLFRGASQWRDSTMIHRTIAGKNNPALLRVRNSNTGAPGNAGPMLETVLDKVNSLFKRLNVYGYRHYHNFDVWMQQTLLASVEHVLFDADSLARDIYRESTLRRLIEETRRGKADHGYLFQILLILELWQRQSL